MQEIFTNLSHEQLKKTKEIGYQLREARENLRYTLDYVSDVIRIPVRSIQQLEEGDFSVLESVFLKGFLKNYCTFIKVDSAPFFEIINEFISDATKSGQEGVPLSTGDKNIWQNPLFLNLLLSAGAVGIVSISIYFLFFFNFVQKEQIKLQDISQNTPLNKEPEQLQDKEYDNLVLSVVAKKDAWARISANENRLFEIFLKKEVKYRWNVKKNFAIILSTADSAEVSLNDKKFKNVTNENEILFLDLNSFDLNDG